MLGLAALCAYTIWSDDRRKQVFVCARMIKLATEVLQSNYLLLLYIPLFVFLLFCLLVLVAFEILAAWSMGQLVFYPEYPFYGVHGFFSNFLTILIFFQFYWGLFFLKQALNFILSGYAVLWYCYYEEDIDKLELLHSPWLLIRYHWGSVLGGSILEGFFFFVDLVRDFFDVYMKIISEQ